MKFTELPLQGAFILELEKKSDERGFFARSFCAREFTDHQLNPDIVQCNLSFNSNRGILRGMHMQKNPFSEAKLVTCFLGTIYDVIIDLRPDSSTYCKWFSIELRSDAYKSLYIPEGFAHGFQTLEDDTLVHYQMSQYFKPEYAYGIRWNDPYFNIDWPILDPIISDKDNNYPDFSA
jgi:dTDP-4-dehydrorhamnose 3,5-epimerase